MSMHAVEDFVEDAVRAVAGSNLAVSEKRDMIHTLFKLEGFGDCGFTEPRTAQEMIESQYTFVFDTGQMWDYKERKEFYDDLVSEKCGGPDGIYAYEGKIYVDSGYDAWSGMVKAGMISGDGAQPVTELDHAYTLKKAKELLGDLDEYSTGGLFALFLLSGAIDTLGADEYKPLFGYTQEELETMMDG